MEPDNIWVYDPNLILTSNSGGRFAFGAFGTFLSHCQTQKHGRIVVKCNISSGTTENITALNRKLLIQFETLRELTHANLLQCHGVTFWDNYCGIMMDYMPMGSLADLIIVQKEIYVHVNVLARMALESSSALAYLHNFAPHKNLVHGDIKPQNMLLTSHLQIKICDFETIEMRETTGASRRSTSTQSAPFHHTALFTAPEYLRDCQLSRKPKMDVYSYGMVLYEMLARKPVFYQCFIDQSVIRENIIAGNRPDQGFIDEQKNSCCYSQQDKALFETMEQIMSYCWNGDSNQRPDMLQVKTTLENSMKDLKMCDVSMQACEVAKQVMAKKGEVKTGVMNVPIWNAGMQTFGNNNQQQQQVDDYLTESVTYPMETFFLPLNPQQQQQHQQQLVSSQQQPVSPQQQPLFQQQQQQPVSPQQQPFSPQQQPNYSRQQPGYLQQPFSPEQQQPNFVQQPRNQPQKLYYQQQPLSLQQQQPNYPQQQTGYQHQVSSQPQQSEYQQQLSQNESGAKSTTSGFIKTPDYQKSHQDEQNFLGETLDNQPFNTGWIFVLTANGIYRFDIKKRKFSSLPEIEKGKVFGKSGRLALVDHVLYFIEEKEMFSLDLEDSKAAWAKCASPNKTHTNPKIAVFKGQIFYGADSKLNLDEVNPDQSSVNVTLNEDQQDCQPKFDDHIERYIPGKNSNWAVQMYMAFSDSCNNIVATKDKLLYITSSDTHLGLKEINPETKEVTSVDYSLPEGTTLPLKVPAVLSAGMIYFLGTKNTKAWFLLNKSLISPTDLKKTPSEVKHVCDLNGILYGFGAADAHVWSYDPEKDDWNWDATEKHSEIIHITT